MSILVNELDMMVHNPYKDAVQVNGGEFYNNLSPNPTVEELNAKTGSSRDVAVRFSREPEAEGADEPVFGTHVRQAAKAVKKLFR